jgi:Na+/melibiose symporter-like transporter
MIQGILIAAFIMVLGSLIGFSIIYGGYILDKHMHNSIQNDCIIITGY